MPFLHRAQAVYDSGNVVGAAIALIEGIKRYPEQTDAFVWLLDIYCEEIDSTGLEEDLVNVIDRCPDPAGTYAYVFERLDRAGRFRFLRELDKTRLDVAKRRYHVILRPWDQLVNEVRQLRAQAAEEAQRRAEAERQAQLAPRDPAPDAPGITVPGRSAAPDHPPTAEHAATGHTTRGKPSPGHPVEPSEAERWERDLPAHPLLIKRQAQRKRTPGRSDDTGPLEVSALLRTHSQPDKRPENGPRQPTRRQDETPRSFEVPDPDALASLGRPVSAEVPEPTARVPRRRPVRRRSPRRRRWTGIAIAVIAVVVGGLAVHRVLQIRSGDEGIAAFEAADGRTDPFLPDQLAEQQSALEGEQATTPSARAQLRWTRALHGYLSPTRAATPQAVPTPKEAAGTDLQVWYDAADVLDALAQGEVASAREVLDRVAERKDRGGFSPALASWLRAEVALAGGDLSAAQLAHEEAASANLVPGIVGLADVCLRRGDLPCLKRALDALEQRAPEHPGVPLGASVEHALARLLEQTSARKLAPADIAPDVVAASQKDRRLVEWVSFARLGQAPTGYRDRGTSHPAMSVLRTQRYLQLRSVDAAVSELSKFRPTHATSALRRTHRRVAISGLANAGHPDIALRHLRDEYPAEADAEALAAWVAQRPEVALMRAALLADLGEYDGARIILAALLKDPVREPPARVVALQLHLSEGRIDDVRRHIDRLADHRGALVAAAAINVYEGRPTSALAVLGKTVESDLPDPDTSPYLYAFEVRTRLLALAGAGRTAELTRVLQFVDCSPALRVRLLGRDQATEDFHYASGSEPASINDLTDLAFEALAAGDAESARKLANKVIRKVPAHTEAHRIIAMVQLESGRDTAAQHFRYALRGRPEHPALSLGPAEAALTAVKGDPLEAIKLLDKKLDNNPGDPAALRLLGRSYFDARYYTVGIKRLQERAAQLHPERERSAAGEIHFWLGRLASARNRTDPRVGVWLRKARDLLGDRPDVLTALGDYYRARDDHAHAFELYQQASATGGGRATPPHAHLNLARMALNRGDRPTARVALERFVQAGATGDNRVWAERQLNRLNVVSPTSP